MNVLFLITKSNLANYDAITAAIQKGDKTEWCRMIFYLDSEIAAAGRKLAQRVLKNAGEVRVIEHQVGVKPDAVKICTMLAMFMAQHYNSYPGPLVIHDGEGVPNCSDWLLKLRTEHRHHEKHFTGCFEIKGASAMPRGPIVFDAPPKTSKLFRYAVNPNWRERGQYVFFRNMHNIDPKNFPFTLNQPEPAQP